MINRKYIKMFEEYIDFIINFYNSIEKERYTNLQYLTIKNIINSILTHIDWTLLSQNQTLSEDFIRAFKHKLYWPYISRHQKLSEEFIIEFKNYISWYRLFYNKNIPSNIKDKFKHKLK